MLASLLAAGATATSASAATCTKYAAPTGADTGAGTLESPFRSVQKLSDSLVSGQVGCLRGGSYTSSSTTYFRSAATTVMSYPGERAKVNGYGEVSRGADGVTLKNIDFVSQGTAHTIRIYGNRTIVEGNDITDSHMSGAGACIGVGGSEDHPDGVIIRLNKIHDCGSNSDTLNHGIYAASFRNLMIRDNIFWMNGGYNIQLYPNGEWALVSHNVIDGSREYSLRGAIVIDGWNALSHVVEQNVIVNVPNAVAALSQRTGSGHIARSNCFYNNAAGNMSGSALTQIDNLVADPRFVNRTARDYRLAADSPCLAKVGYDTAALIAGAATAPDPTPLPPPLPVPTNDAPAVTLTSPANGSTVWPGNVLLTATASDDRGVTSVSFYIDGKLQATDRTVPYTARWIVSKKMRGYHLVMAKAFDAHGRSARSSSRVRSLSSSALRRQRVQACLRAARVKQSRGGRKGTRLTAAVRRCRRVGARSTHRS